MTIISDYGVTQKELRILQLLFLYRGMTRYQITSFLHPNEFDRLSTLTAEEYIRSLKRKNAGRKNDQNELIFRSKTNTHINIDLINKHKKLKSRTSTPGKHIVSLVKKSLVKELDIPRLRDDEDKTSNLKQRYAFLTKLGYDLITEDLGLEEGYIGEGYNHDFGYFDYALHRPPARYIQHHLHLIDFFLILENLKAKYPSIQIDYRDNRYVSSKYPSSTKETKTVYKKFMPDGEVLLNGKRFWVEIDRQTESGPKLAAKFHGYAQYIDHLKETNKPIPEGVIFIQASLTSGKSQTTTRWNTIFTNFYESMGRRASDFNLYFSTFTDVEETILRASRVELYNDIETNTMQGYLKNIKDIRKSNERSPGSSGSFTSGFYILDSSGAEISRTIHVKSGKVVDIMDFAYARVDRFETRGLSQIKNLTKTNQSDFSSDTKILFLLYHGTRKIEEIRDLIITEEMKQYFSQVIWLSFDDARPVWYDMDGQRIHPTNPFLGYEVLSLHSEKSS